MVGVSFVDVLFALVIGEVLNPLRDFNTVTTAGRAQLVLATVITLTSWVGYHNSHNRPQYFIRFPNLPLGQFVLDVAMVIVYWLTAVQIERRFIGPRGRWVSDVPSARWDAVLVAVAFLLYVLWDLVGKKIRESAQYRERPASRDVPARRHVTGVFCFGAVVGALVVVRTDPSSTAWVVAIDLALCAWLILFRFAKEYFTKEDPFGDVPRFRAYITAGEAAAWLDVPVADVYRLASDGDLAHTWKDETLRLDLESVKAHASAVTSSGSAGTVAPD